MAVVLHLVRHGQASAGFGDDLDPGLSELGARQAAATAALLAPAGPLPVLTSPLRRCRETAAPLEAAWATSAVVEPAVAEIPSPTDVPAERAAWLGPVLRGRWEHQDDALHTWRAALLERLLAVPSDAVVVTHFVAINVVVGAATGDGRLTCCSPANASTTVVEADAATGRFRVRRLGDEAATAVR